MRTLKAGGTLTVGSLVSKERIAFPTIYAKEVVVFSSTVVLTWKLAEFSDVWIATFINGIRAIAKELLIFIKI